MLVVKTCVLFAILFLIIIVQAKGQEVTEQNTDTTALINNGAGDGEATNTVAPSGNRVANLAPQEPPFGTVNPPPNIFQNLFAQFLKPLKVSGKTYGPSIIAIIGDKPYISLEVFNKFSPLKWLMNAFQGKVQSICGLLAPPNQEQDLSETNPQNFLDQLIAENQRPPAGTRPSTFSAGPIRIYDVHSGYASAKRRSGSKQV